MTLPGFHGGSPSRGWVISQGRRAEYTYCDHPQPAKRHLKSAPVRGASRYAATSTPNTPFSVGAGKTRNEHMARCLA
jgi:hypothetical protein